MEDYKKAVGKAVVRNMILDVNESERALNDAQEKYRVSIRKFRIKLAVALILWFLITGMIILVRL